MAYLPRIVDKEIKNRLASIGALLIEGPRAVGKSETAGHHAASSVILDVDQSARAAAAIEPRILLEGDIPRLFDEWQLVPELWNVVRHEVDRRHKPGQFMLAGSATPADDITRHTGAGRISRLRLRTMSLSETGVGNKQASLSKLLRSDDNDDFACTDPKLSLDDLIEFTCVGGWPALVGKQLKTAQRFAIDYLEEIRRTDIREMAGVKHDPNKIAALFTAIARNTLTEATNERFRQEMSVLTFEDVPLNETVSRYLDTLERLMIIEPLLPFRPHLRARSRVHNRKKQMFFEPSLAVAALRAKPEDLKRDLEFFGFLFESLVLRDLRTYSESLDGHLYHYRDNTGLEVDAIIEISSEHWAAIEVKLGASSTTIDTAAKSLLRFASKLDYKVRKKPRFLAVITGSGYGYKRDDGVLVIPIGALTE